MVRRALSVFALALALFVAAGPLLEAAVPCGQECLGGEREDGCALDPCCSCCVHLRFDPTRARQAPSLEPPIDSVDLRPPQAVSWPDPREIAHVPKTRAR